MGKDKDAIDQGRTHGRALIAKGIQRLEEALDATKFDEVAGEIPDHSIRLRAVAEVCDRFGLPKKTEIEASNPYSTFLSEVAEAFKARQ